MLDSINNDKVVSQPNSDSGIDQINSESNQSSQTLKSKISKSKSQLKSNSSRENNVFKNSNKQANTKTNSKCPSNKPEQVKPKLQIDKQKFEKAKQEKEALLKEIKASNMDPLEAVKELEKLKTSLDKMDNSFQISIEKNQRARDAYNTSKFTDRYGNSGALKDYQFYKKNNDSTVEYMQLRSSINKEMKNINKVVLKQEMKFLRA